MFLKCRLQKVCFNYYDMLRCELNIVPCHIVISAIILSYLLEFFFDLDSAYEKRPAHCIFHFPEIYENIILGEDFASWWSDRHAAAECSVGSRPVDYRFSSRQECRYSTSRRPWPRRSSQLFPRPRPTARDNSVPPACLRHRFSGRSSLFTSNSLSWQTVPVICSAV